MTLSSSFKGLSETFDSLTLVELFIKSDSILSDRLDKNGSTVEKSYLKIGCNEYMISHTFKEVKKVIYPEQFKCYEGKYNKGNLQLVGKNVAVNGHICKLYEFHSKDNSEIGQFWIDESSRFQSSMPNFIIKGLGIVIKSKVIAPALKVEVELINISIATIDKNVFQIPSSYYQREFFAPVGLIK